MTSTREDAISFLKSTLEHWPEYLDGYFGPKEFKGWRFVEALDGEILFANCIEPGISKNDIPSINGWPDRCGMVKH